ncbi:alpha/beta hydrolase [Rhodococcus sp. IEGM 1330]|uniref:alpha/beta hydrolase n=1 Tax=Rhodococcus sp. IEGM 1330 TaxID=3082225 RepID=UPI002954BCB5|nr:alpha/beta fold hydrolase [Rhodococcus sp. IEGM 1330]MDV8022747.1 alpha/beta fold hydrolase [Rhodococcus sp. IEGM 1330]
MNSFSRLEATFTSFREQCSAWVYRPTVASDERMPVVVLANGFGGHKGIRLHAFAERFAAAGLVAVAFDFRSFGASGGTPRHMLSIRGQRADWDAAVGFVRSLDYVDPARVGAWGTSLSGGHVLELAARDRELAAVVAQVPHVSGLAAARSVGFRASARLSRVAVADVVAGVRGTAPVYVPVCGEPGDTAFLTSPDAPAGFERILAASEGPTDDNTVGARAALAMPGFSPNRRARDITCPVLMQIGSQDVVTPVAASRRCAERIARVEVREYDCEHFAPYVDPWFERFVHDQVEFFVRTLATSTI